MKDEQVYDLLPFLGFEELNPLKSSLKAVQAFFKSDIWSGDGLGCNLEALSCILSMTSPRTVRGMF